MRRITSAVLALLAVGLTACERNGRSITDPGGDTLTVPAPATIPVLGQGRITHRFTSELWVHGDWAYTGTWGTRSANGAGNVLYVWNVSADTPVLADSIVVPNAQTLGDVQVSDDGRLLVVATELQPGSLVIFDLADPARPRQIARFSSPSTQAGVHTAEVARVDGRLYAFLSINSAQLVVVDLDDPAEPRQVLARSMGRPFIHDVFVRDGLLFTALWNDGTTIWDIGGGGRGGTPANPIQITNIQTVGGKVHNVWWFHNPVDGSKRYLFVGEEGPGSGAFGTSSSGDIHVVDLGTGDMRSAREVAFYHVPGAGTHNFSVDEASGILYAAYYNGGVRALDIRGDLSACTVAQRAPDGRCDLRRMGREVAVGLTAHGAYVWGVHWTGGPHLYASDMLNGLWKLDVSALRR
jgi:hypothetical protein